MSTIIKIYVIYQKRVVKVKETFINYQHYSTKLQERLKYFSILSTENITKSLSYEEAIKEYAAKRQEKGIIEVFQAVN